ncbi:MAG: hypothetical protein JXR07_20245 [Reichenbachiella sp.]
MRHEIRFWGFIVIVFLSAITWLVFYLLRNVIKYYKAPHDILQVQYSIYLAIFNALAPLIPAIIIVNQFISQLPTLNGFYEQNQLLYPISIFVVLILLIVSIGLAIESALYITNSQYRNFKSEKGS